MNATAAKERGADHARVSADAVRVGKDVIELLTSGMYVSPITIYREYIQNAADSIDEARAAKILRPNEPGRVLVSFDHQARSISIRDDGAGIPTGEVLSALLGVGGSRKRGTPARGFRGVGRLSGLAYCRELEFTTKAAGEKRTVSVTWDCEALRNRLFDPSFDGDLSRIVSDVVSVWYDEANDVDEHFFQIRLGEVARLRSDVLLNEQLVGQYLAQVAPVPFAPEFSFAAQIQERFSRLRPSVPLDLTVGGEVVRRPHRDELILPGSLHPLRIEEIEFLEFADVDGETGAVGWIAHHEYVRSIPVGLGVRGLRARFGDLQVGEANLFDDSFKEPRFNGWSIGELHVLDRRIVPNARRDNFEVNHHYYNLLVQLGPVTARIAQRCRAASISRNAAQIIQNSIEEGERRLAEKRKFDSAELSRLKSALLRSRTKLKRVADKGIRQKLEKRLERLWRALGRLKSKKGASVVAIDEAASLVSRLVTNRAQAKLLIEELRRLCD